jgi:hypothetical protein
MKRRHSWRSRWAAILFLVWAVAGSALAEQCAVCQERIIGEFFWLNNPALPAKVPLCRACAKLDTVCATCRVPVKRDFLRLDDGRLLCANHARGAVLTQQDAEAVFHEAKRETIRLLRGYGSTPDRNITLSLVDATQMARFREETQALASLITPVGLTRSRRQGTDFSHSIYLLSGQSRARLLATGAHEYAHAWMAENVPPDRKLDSNAVEGFCELAAYRIMADLQEEAERRYILSNAYTRGQIGTFVQAEDSHRFYRIVEWIKNGVESRIELENTTSVLALKPEPPAAPAWPQAAPTRVPDTLQLKGISGRPGRYLALVNDLNLEVGETGRARVGDGKVTVRCVSPTQNSAVIELVDSGERRELVLRGQ